MMNKNDYTGLKNVYTFSFVQSMKSRLNIIVTIVLSILCFFSIPIMLVFYSDSDEKNKQSDITDVYVCDETGLGLYDSIQKHTNIVYEDILCHQDYTKLEDLKEISGDNSIYINIKFDSASGFSIMGIYDTKDKLTNESVDTYMQIFENGFKNIIADASGIDDETLKNINKEINMSVVKKDDDMSKNNKSSQGASDFSTTIVFVILFILAICGENIATSIATEKATKVIEYLLINIRPMALITGKVLASVSVVLIQVLCGAAGLFASWLIFGGKNSNAMDIFNQTFSHSDILNNISIIGCFVSVFVFVAGFIFYGLLAGISGAAVSKVENIGEGMKIYSFLLIICSYSSIVISMLGEIPVYLYLIPFTSVFILPSGLILGEVSFGLAVTAFVILIVMIIIILKFVSNVYESMIFYNGETLGIKQIISMSNKRGRNK